jgi:hypothetical protein
MVIFKRSLRLFRLSIAAEILDLTIFGVLYQMAGVWSRNFLHKPYRSLVSYFHNYIFLLLFVGPGFR